MPVSPTLLQPSHESMQTPPNVFVVPPEEDQSPAWCLHDAKQPNIPNTVESSDDQSPTFTVFSDEDASARREYEQENQPQRRLTSVVDALMASDHQTAFDSDSEGENDIEIPEIDVDSAPNSPTTIRNPADDSDVVEVVKVRRIRRTDDDMDLEPTVPSEPTEPKRTKTLKSRASRAFRSLRGTLRSGKPRAQDVFTSEQPPPIPPLPTDNAFQSASLPRSRTPTMSRRGSNIFSLFKAPSIKSQSSMASFDDASPVSAEPPVPPIRSSISTYDQPLQSPASATFSHRLSIYDAEAIDEARLQASSPTPTTASTKSSRKRFSVLSLQKLFSFSGQSSSAGPSNPSSFGGAEPHSITPIARPFARVSPSVSSSISTTSGSGPQTPTSTDGCTSVRIVEPEDRTLTFHDFDNGFDALNLTLALGSNGSTTEPQPTTHRSIRPSSTISSRTVQLATPKKYRAPTKGSSAIVGDDDEADRSLEMKLDSFHFDSLSFDADRFILSSP